LWTNRFLWFHDWILSFITYLGKFVLYNKFAMRLFGKGKKKEDEDEEIESSKKDSDKPKRRRRKKEEPLKPWGRGERFLVLAVLCTTIIIAVVLALNARSWKLPGLPRIGVPKGVFEETYVFEGKPPVRDTSAIVNEFNRLTQETSGVYGLYVVSLNTDESYGINEEEVFQAASLIKLPVMAAMYAEHEKGNIDLDKTYVLRSEDKTGGSGSLVYQENGSEYSYRELVGFMGQQSDNTAFTVCTNLLGEELIDDYIIEFGMNNTSFEDNEMTPRDIGLFFKNLWERKIVDRAARDEVLKFLTDTIYESWIKAGIPDVRVAHKFGREVHVVNDAGIVFADDPYVLVIMSKGIIESEADELMPLLAAAVHRFEVE